MFFRGSLDSRNFLIPYLNKFGYHLGGVSGYPTRSIYPDLNDYALVEDRDDTVGFHERNNKCLDFIKTKYQFTKNLKYFYSKTIIDCINDDIKWIGTVERINRDRIKVMHDFEYSTILGAIKHAVGKIFSWQSNQIEEDIKQLQSARAELKGMKKIMEDREKAVSSFRNYCEDYTSNKELQDIINIFNKEFKDSLNNKKVKYTVNFKNIWFSIHETDEIMKDFIEVISEKTKTAEEKDCLSALKEEIQSKLKSERMRSMLNSDSWWSKVNAKRAFPR